MRRRLRAALLAAGLLALAGCKVNLYSRLGEPEALEMVALLLRNGIDADRVMAKDGTNTIEVDKARLADAIDLLRSHQLPRPTFATMGEVFQQQGLIASPTEERARFIFALSQELSHTLSEIDGVLSARVHVVLPHNDPLRQEDEPAAAAVFIRHDARVPIDDILPQVKLLVANSIQGLSYDKVTVVMLPVNVPDVSEEIRKSAAAPADWLDAPPSGLLMGGAGALLVLAGGGVLLLLRRRKGRADGGGVVLAEAVAPGVEPVASRPAGRAAAPAREAA